MSDVKESFKFSSVKPDQKWVEPNQYKAWHIELWQLDRVWTSQRSTMTTPIRCSNVWHASVSPTRLHKKSISCKYCPSHHSNSTAWLSYIVSKNETRRALWSCLPIGVVCCVAIHIIPVNPPIFPDLSTLSYFPPSFLYFNCQKLLMAPQFFLAYSWAPIQQNPSC